MVGTSSIHTMSTSACEGAEGTGRKEGVGVAAAGSVVVGGRAAWACCSCTVHTLLTSACQVGHSVKKATVTFEMLAAL